MVCVYVCEYLQEVSCSHGELSLGVEVRGVGVRECGRTQLVTVGQQVAPSVDPGVHAQGVDAPTPGEEVVL